MATSLDLLQIQFIKIGYWNLINSKLDYNIDYNFKDLTIYPNILYSFVLEENDNDKVMYIGKTTKSLKQRFSGYVKPGKSQQTNIRVNEKLRQIIGENSKIAIYLFKDLDCLQWGGYNLNLPAGLEDALVNKLMPEWNKTGKDKLITTTEEIESIEIFQNVLNNIEPNYLEIFEVTLGETYFNKPYLNPGIKFDEYFGNQDEEVILHLGNNIKLKSKIDRNANANKSPRLYFKSELIQFYKTKFKLGDKIQFGIISKNEIQIISNNF